MPYSVRCKACSSAFAIPDEIWDKRVKGRIATLKCRSCKAEIHVDGTKAGVVQISAPPPPMTADERAEQRSVRPQPITTTPEASTQQDRTPLSEASAEKLPATPQPSSAAANKAGVAEAPHAPNVKESAVASRAKVGGLATKAGTPGIATIKTVPAATASTLSHKPAAKGAREIAAPESGWSLMPPPGEIQAPDSSLLNSSASLLHSKEPTTVPEARLFEAKMAEQPAAVAAPQSVSPGELLQDPPIDPDLWVVSFGDDDDRELTEKQIAAELAKGGITLSTIVWQEGMPEWLPISGVKKLAQLAPLPKSAPRQTKVTGAAKAGPSPTKASSPLSTTRADSPAARQPAAQRQKQPSQSQLEAPGTAHTESSATRAPAAPVEQSSAKGPPPLVRALEHPTEEHPTKSTLPVSRKPQRTAGSDAAESASAASVPARPPALVRRGQSSLEATARGGRNDGSDGVLTSAPDVTATNQQADKQPGKPPALPGTGSPLSSGGVNSPNHPTLGPAGAAVQELAQRSSPKQSFRPPKPVETATSLVTRTDTSAGKDLLITDEDFLAMQRRFPKWALPVGIIGGAAAVAAIVYAANTDSDLPPLPVAPVADTSTVLRENPANRAQPKHPQPNLDAVPAVASNTAVASKEKDFARLFAQSASKTNSTFDSKAADRAAMNFMELAARCRVAPDPSGQARVVITFSTAGQVVSVQVGSPYADTATGRCIDKALRNIKTKAFQGEPGRLPLTVPIH